MNLCFTAVVIVVLFVGAPSLESIGARAQTQATYSQCQTACAAASRRDDSVIRTYINQRIRLCNCICFGINGGGILHVSAVSGCGVCISLLTTSPSNCRCDDRDFAQNTPLHSATSICNGPTTSDLIRAGCNKNARNRFGDTPLCLAARNPSGGECGQVVRTLLDRNIGGVRASPCIRCSGNTTACQSCAQTNTCNVLRQDGACNC